MQYYQEFAEWLDKHLNQELPDEIVAFSFNVYEGADPTWHIELIGTDEFDEEDEDWACSEVFTTRENMYFIPRLEELEDWKSSLKLVENLVSEYLKNGDYASKLKATQAVAVGFVDGDLQIVYRQ